MMDIVLDRNRADIFWGYVDQSGGPDACWPWTKCNREGYGQFWVKPRQHPAHRVAFVVSGGVLTPEKPWVLHRCDNPLCCNPAHLFAGSHQDNVNDMVAKKRKFVGPYKPGFSQGERNGGSKLTETQVKDIRAKLIAGFRGKDLAKEYGVSPQCISFIRTRYYWKHL